MPSPEETTRFAEAIQSLLSSSPPSLSGSSQTLSVLTHLVDADFLNGTSEDSSVWQALQQLPTIAPLPSLGPPVAHTSLDSVVPTDVSPLFLFATGEQVPHSDLEILDDGSCCLSCPLDPTTPDQVTLAPHSIELVEVPEQERPSSPGTASSGKWWDLPWSKNKHGEAPAKKRVVAKKTFYPPTDRVSVLVAWWGYQVFLPHSIIESLGTSIAPFTTAMSSITTAISYIANNAPAYLLLLPGGALIKSLGLPIIAAIGALLTFYWVTVKGKDEGEGVVLAATWLVPVALVPRRLDRSVWGRQGEGETVMMEKVDGRGGEKERKTALRKEGSTGSMKQVAFRDEFPYVGPEKEKKEEEKEETSKVGGLFRRVKSRKGKK